MLAPYDQSEGTFDQYLKEIGQYDLIDREEERRLGALAQKGDQGAIDALVLANMRFVVSTAKKYARPGISLQELVSQGNIGLIQAAHKFDPDKNVKFISYGVWWIRQQIHLYLAEFGHAFRLPQSRYDEIRTVHAVASVYENQGEERYIAMRLSAIDYLEKKGKIEDRDKLDPVEEQAVENLIAVTQMTHVSLDGPAFADDDDTEFGSRVGLEFVDPLATYAIQDVRAELADSAAITEREKKIIFLYYGMPDEQFNKDGEDLTLEEIAVLLGVTRERIRQIRNKAFEKLRESNRTRLQHRWELLQDDEHELAHSYSAAEH